MVYRKRLSRKRVYKKKPVTAYQKATKALKMVRSLKRHEETKCLQAYSAGQLATNWSGNATGTLFNMLSGLTQGTQAQNNRIGDKITLTSMMFRYRLLVNNASGATNQVCRVILLTMKHEDAFSASNLPAKLILPANLGTFQAPTSNFRQSDIQDVKILYDKIHTLNYQQTNDGVVRTCRPKVSNHEIEFAPQLSTTENGGIFCMVIGDAVTNGAFIAYDYQINFKDS